MLATSIYHIFVTKSPIKASQVVLVAKNLLANAGDIRDEGLIPGLVRSPEAANGNPLQYSCLENSIDRRTWQATVHRVTNSRTRPKLLGIKSLREHRIHHFWWKSEEQKVAWKKMCGSREGIREEEISSVTIVRKPGKKYDAKLLKTKADLTWLSALSGSAPEQGQVKGSYERRKKALEVLEETLAF